MDDHQFDRLTCAFATAPRRSILRLGFAAVGAIAASRARPAQAKQEQSWTCEAGLMQCADAGCVDLQTDLDHCGACDSPCVSQLVSVACRSGECVRADCPPELEYCGPIDLCRDLRIDATHCGGCGNACASGVCEGGICAPTADGACPAGTAGCSGCEPGQTACEGACVDTCCDPENCGACGVVCPEGQTCFEGVCDCPSGLCCEEGEVLCGDTCVATCCSNQHCGACGHACPEGQTCFEGVCGCPKGSCPPVELPKTGVGPGASPEVRPWAVLAAAAAATAAGLRLRSHSSSRIAAAPQGATEADRS